MELTKEALVSLSVSEAIALGARDIPTFGQIFFEKTFRQKSPAFHYDESSVLETPDNRLIGLEVFRDGAKTTIARAYIAKRIAYCISRTLMIVNINSTKAEQSLRWLKRQVMYNRKFADSFHLKRGDKWNDAWATFINSEGEVVNVVAFGITAGLRGLNIDDYRPDFIFCDDICDAENTATEEGRKKLEEAVFAQLVRSLSPKSESPMAQLVIAQTPINSFDIISQAKLDPTFKVFSYSCFDNAGQSTWPERRTTDELKLEKQGYINRNQLATWLAEMECQIVSKATQAFQISWLRKWQVYPADGRIVIAIDPASSEEKTADFFAMVLMLFYQKNVYLIEYSLERGMMPDAACAKIFEWARTYGARDLVVETVAYQKILKWYIERESKERRVFLNIQELADKRKKEDRIIQAITQVAPYGNLYIRDGMTEFEESFELYGPGYKGKDDLLDATSMGIIWKFRSFVQSDDDAIEGEFDRLREEEGNFPDSAPYQGAP